MLYKVKKDFTQIIEDGSSSIIQKFDSDMINVFNAYFMNIPSY